MAPRHIFLSGVSAGCLLVFACSTVLVANTARRGCRPTRRGLLRILASFVFPYGLVYMGHRGKDGGHVVAGVCVCVARF